MSKQAHEQVMSMNKDMIQHKSQQLNQLLLDNAHDLIAIHKLADLSYEYVNPATIKVLGYPLEELLALNPLELFHPDDIPKIVEKLKEDPPQVDNQHEFRYRKKNGAYVWLEITIAPLYRENEDTALLVISRDITDRKQAEAELQDKMDSQAFLLEISRNFANVAVDAIDAMITDTLRMIGEFCHNDRSYIGLFTEDKSTLSKTYEWCAEGITGKLDNAFSMPIGISFWWKHILSSQDYIHIPRVTDLPDEAQTEKNILQTQSVQSLLAVPILMEDEIIGYLGLDSVRCEQAWAEKYFVILETVGRIIAKAVNRQKYAKSLLASENYYRTIFENTGAATIIVDDDMTITMVNDKYTGLLGYEKDELIGQKWTKMVPADKIDVMKAYHDSRRLQPGTAPTKYTTQIIDKEGKFRDGRMFVDIIPGTNKSVATFMDLTRFNRVDRALKIISTITAAMIKAENEEDLLQTVCRKLVKVSGYSMAWVGYVCPDQQQHVQPVAWSGSKSYVDKLNISLQDPERGQGPTGTAIRTGQPVVSIDFKKDDTVKPWFKDVLRRGFKSCIAIPLLAENKAFGSLGIYSNEIDVFDNEEQKLLLDMANNLAYVIISLRTRLEKDQTVRKFEKSLEKMHRILMQAVTSLGTALGVKDPYTAGHQIRVARLATAIAENLGLSRDQIEGIAVVGNLHDIGKIKIPSEILSKPGKLSNLEFCMVKTHSQAGYEIIKEIEFPWPVAEVLLQHHERMNGSGYPRGLAGEEILMEARIMAVADVVEALASHRPYRPALGIDAALEEISKEKGVLYDPDVVEACINLFQAKGFCLI